MKTTPFLVVCSLLLMVSVANGTADKIDDEQRVDADERAPLKPVEEGGGARSVSVPLHLPGGNDAGCDFRAGISRPSNPAPAGPGACAAGTTDFGIGHTLIICSLIDDCWIDTFDWATFGSIFIRCNAGSQATIDWASNVVVDVPPNSCSVSASGDPTAFSSWDALGGYACWVHTDNLFDVGFHSAVC